MIQPLLAFAGLAWMQHCLFSIPMLSTLHNPVWSVGIDSIAWIRSVGAANRAGDAHANTRIIAIRSRFMRYLLVSTVTKRMTLLRHHVLLPKKRRAIHENLPRAQDGPVALGAVDEHYIPPFG